MNEERQRAVLERAVADRDLVDAVPAVVAFGFGVLPVAQRGTTLTVACLPGANRDALRLLRDVLEREIVAAPFLPRPLLGAIARAYPAEETPAVNFPTFLEPDFLARPGTAGRLRTSKVETLGETGSRLDPGAVVLAALTFRTTLDNLDLPPSGGALPDPHRTKRAVHDQPLAWTLGPEGPALWGDRPEDPAPVLHLNQFRHATSRSFGAGASDGETRAAGESLGAAALPLVVHPTEVQLVRLERDGALVFHAHDREETIGERGGRFALRYHFLASGQRQRREIELVVHEALRRDAASLPRRAGEAPWGRVEVARFLGLAATLDGA